MRALTLLWILATIALGAVGWKRAFAQPAEPEQSRVERDAGDLSTTGAPSIAGDPSEAGDLSESAASDLLQIQQPSTLIASLTVFILAVFVGFEIITKVPPTLHTPLMSGSNAISGIAVVGALLVAGGSAYGASRTWGVLAVLLATINVVGGFLVTHRMLAMFNKPRPKPSPKTS